MDCRERMLVVAIVGVDRIVEAASCNVCCNYAIPNTRIDSLLQQGLASLVTHHQLARLRDLHLVCSLEVKVYRDRLCPMDRASLKCHRESRSWRTVTQLRGPGRHN